MSLRYGRTPARLPRRCRDVATLRAGLSESLPFPFTGVEDQAPSQTETVGSSAARNAIAESADGTGRLADGTAWEKRSGEEFGANGFWKRWYLIRGQNVDGTKWEECWWEVTGERTPFSPTTDAPRRKGQSKQAHSDARAP